MSTDNTLKLPPRFIKICAWFWEKQSRMWLLLGGKIFTLLVWLIGLWLTNDPTTLKAWHLYSVKVNTVQNWLVYTLILLILFIILLSFTAISYIVSHIPAPLSLQTLPEEAKQKKEQVPEQPEHDLKRIYLRYLQQQVELLPPLGLGVSDLISPQGMRLADVFIRLEFRESPKALRLLPFGQDEIAKVSGLNRQHKDYLLIDPRGEWEREFMRRDRMGIFDLWELLFREKHAAVNTAQIRRDEKREGGEWPGRARQKGLRKS